MKCKITSKKNVITESLAKDWYADKIGKIFITENYFVDNKKDIMKKYFSELLDPEDSDEHNIFKLDKNTLRKNINIDGDIFEVECDISRVLVGFYRFSFKRISSQYIKKPLLIGNDTKTFSKELDEFEYGLTNSNSPIRVLKKLQSIMLTFINRHSPRGISFKDYDEGRRSKVYSYMAKKLCKISNYYLLEANNHFFLFKDKDDMTNIKTDMDI